MGLLNRLKFVFKSFVFGTLIITCALYGVVASLILRLIGKQEYAQYTVARVFYFTFSNLLGIKITIKHADRLYQRPAVVVANHQSALDILVLGKVFKPGYTVTAKKVLRYFPFLGWFMLASGTFFLDRAKGEKARKVLDTALHGLKKDNKLIFMFPEGTRSATKSLDMLPFKKGAFHLAKQANIPVIPVVVSNYSTLFCSADSIFNRGEITIEVLEPMSTSDLKSNEDVTEFSEEVRSRMLASIENMGYATVNGQSVSLPSHTSSEATSDDEDVGDAVSEETPLVVLE